MDDSSAFWANSSIHRTLDTELYDDSTNLSPQLLHQSFPAEHHQQEYRRREFGSCSMPGVAHQAAENALLPTSQGLRSSFYERLMAAIVYFISMTADTSVLIQVWVPVSVDGVRIALTTVRQPHHLHDPDSTHLGNYRVWSESFMLSADEGSMDGLGMPGRVYLKKEAEWSPDVRLFKEDECPRLNHAHAFNIRGSIALPVFSNESGHNCLGVVEIVTTTPKLTCRPEIETICLALAAVNLRSSEILTTITEEGQNAELSKITQLITAICDEYGLPLGQTWALDHNSHCATTVDKACYVRDQLVSGFRTACTEQPLRRGQGVVGKAFETNGPCYSADITEDSKAEYPLSHHAKLFGLRGAVAVQLQCLHPTSKAYVVEFFLPVGFQGPGIAFLCMIMESLAATLPASHRFLNECPISSDGAPTTSWGNLGVGIDSSVRICKEAERGMMISFGGDIKDRFSSSPRPNTQGSIRLRARGKCVARDSMDAHKAIVGDLEQMLSGGAPDPDPDLFDALLQNPYVLLMMNLLSSTPQYMAQVWNTSPEFRRVVKHPELLRLLSTDEIGQQISHLTHILSSRGSI